MVVISPRGALVRGPDSRIRAGSRTSLDSSSGVMPLLKEAQPAAAPDAEKRGAGALFLRPQARGVA